MTDPTPFDAIYERVLEGQAPANVRAAAARGALPLPRPKLLRLQIHLLADEQDEIRTAARASLEELNPEALHEVLVDPTCDEVLLVHFAKRATREEKVAEAIVFHPTAPLRAIAPLAAGGNATVIDLVLTNQELLLARPALLESLMLNPALRPDQRGRLLELLERSYQIREERAAQSGSAEAGTEPGQSLDELGDAEELARVLDLDIGELMSASEILGGEEFETTEDVELRSTYQKILELNPAQKAILAMKGGREERLILVRDSNKTVALGVLKNGRITENEIESIAKMRNVTDEVLRQIGINREWTKSYAVMHALVHNPRTPQAVASNFVGRLTLRDLRSLASSREVPELIRRMARRTLDQRTQAQRVTFKRK